MARGVNQVILVGYTTKAAELKYMANGNAVANFTIATNEAWKDKNTGEQKEKAEFHRVVLFRRLAEIAGQYVKSGSLLYISGKLQTRKWTDKNGADRYTTEIIANEMQMLGGNNQQQGGYGQGGNFNQQQPNMPDFDQMNDEDFPF